MKLRYRFVINQVAGETVAVSVGNTEGSFNGFIKLNETGAFIFKKLESETCREGLIDAVLDEYPDASREDAAESVDKLIERLKEAELLV